MFRNYFKTAFRGFWRNKRISLINLFGLSIGMTASVFIFLWIQNEMSYDDYHPQKENIYRITNTIQVNKDENWVWQNSPYPMADACRNELAGVESAARIMPNEWAAPVVRAGNNPEPQAEKNSAYVDNNWFSIFHYDFVAGSANDFNNDMYGLVLTATSAKKYFGNTDVTGKIMQINDQNYTIRAVVKDNPANSSFRYDVFMPLTAYVKNSKVNEANNWNNFNYMVFLKLKPGTQPAVITSGINGLVKKYRAGNAGNHTVSLIPLSELHFETGLQNPSPTQGNRKTVYIFSILGILLLVIACINYVNLTTAKASLRAKEVSVRKIVGAGKTSLFLQFLVESLVMSFTAMLISVILIQCLVPLFQVISGTRMVVSFSSPVILRIFLIVLAAVTCLNGLYPALLLSSFKPLEVFRGKKHLTLNDASLRKGLVVFQFCISMILITATVVIYRQMKYIQESNPGYSVSQLMAIHIPWKAPYNGRNEARTFLFASMKNELMKQQGIRGIATGNNEIINVTSATSGSVDWNGRDTTYNPTIARLSADAGFLSLFQLHMQSGRWFEEGKYDEKGFILNETAAREFRMHTPLIGQRIRVSGDTGQVIGVVKDFYYKSMHDKIGPMIISNNKGSDAYIFIRTEPGKIPQAIAATKSVWNQFLPNEPFQYSFLDDNFNNLYKADIKTSKLVFIFSLIAIVVSALGLFGLASFLSEQRTREIGIRKVLGASVQHIAILLSREFVLLVTIAILIAAPVAWWLMNRWLDDFAYRIHINIWIVGISGTIAMLIALVSIGSQTIQAAVENPVKSLRSE